MQYDRQRVEALIPGVWDDTRVLNARDDYAPDPDMPKAPQVDPRRSTDKVTELADIKRAWDLAPLTPALRVTLVGYYGLQMTQRELGSCLGISHAAVDRRTYKAVGVLMDFLNGTNDFMEEEE